MEKINAKLINWASHLEAGTRAQAETTATMPFIHPHLALMPDAHLGLGATVGSVIPTLGAIMPAAVGVDIGCGMIAVRTQSPGRSCPEDRRPLREAIERAVPLSAGAANRKVSREHTEQRVESSATSRRRPASTPRRTPRWELQLGTLGSGNHFIEVTPRRARPGVAVPALRLARRRQQDRPEAHQGRAGVCRQHWIDLPDRDLAYLVEGTDEFWAYIREMRWAQHYALLNREEMMDRVAAVLRVGRAGRRARLEEINCHHNYTEQETALRPRRVALPQGRDQRRGRASRADPGLDGHGVVRRERARGNPVALNSAPHGAGRAYSRSRRPAHVHA
jgi:tRNA-splicing ligase RtcB